MGRNQYEAFPDHPVVLKGWFPGRASKVRRCAVPSSFGTPGSPLIYIGLFLTNSTSPTLTNLSIRFFNCPYLTIMNALVASRASLSRAFNQPFHA